MKRRSAIKGLLAVATLGVSGAVYKFFDHADPLPLHQLPQKSLLIAELAETIIPRTNTPGAKDCKVEEYIIKMVSQNSDAKAQKSFLIGLNEIENYAGEKHQRSFAACNYVERQEILKHFEDKATYSINILNKVQRKVFGLPFFYQLRQMTVEGYATSQLGATQGMAYDYIPGAFQGCIPLQKDQLAWSTK